MLVGMDMGTFKSYLFNNRICDLAEARMKNRWIPGNWLALAHYTLGRNNAGDA